MAISSNTTGLRPGVCTSTSRPSSPYTGQTIFETDTNRMYVWNGSAWVIPNSPAQNPMGLELVKTHTIIGTTSSVTVSDVFSATYDNYRIMFSGVSSSASTNLRLQLGSQITGYYGFLTYGSYSSSTVLGDNRNNVNLFDYVGGAISTEMFAEIELQQPFLARGTLCKSLYLAGANLGNFVGYNNAATSFTSFTVSPGTGTMSGGTILVYGYRK